MDNEKTPTPELLSEEVIQPRVRAYMELAGCSIEEAKAHVYRMAPGILEPVELFASVARVDPHKTFASYISCTQNEFPVELLSHVSTDEEFASKYSPVYVYANVGLGKTHLFSAVMNEMRGRRTLFINTAELETIILSAKQHGLWANFRAYFKGLDLLCIDDIQLCEGMPEVQREIFAIINTMVEERRTVLISSDVPPTRLKNIEQRLASRLGGGVIVTLTMGDLAYRQRILAEAFPRLGRNPQVVRYLAEEHDASVRALLAAGRTVMAFMSAREEEPTVAEIRLLLGRPQAISSATTPATLPVANEAPQTRSDRGYITKFKQMLEGAESEEEYFLAIQIAVNTRLTELRRAGGPEQEIGKFERALELVQKRDLQEVIQLIGM